MMRSTNNVSIADSSGPARWEKQITMTENSAPGPRGSESIEKVCE